MYVKDAKSGVVYNDSDAELRATISLRERAKREKRLQKEMQELQTELSDIRGMLQGILNNRENR